jgi:tryptophanyl-tRNA synthetase
MKQKKSIIFSGIQPSGNLTIGNYLGALKNWVGLQEQYDCLFSLVDLHTVTVRQNPKEFYQHCYDVLAIYLAAGLDSKKSALFLQSHVPAHSQLAWILNCYAYIGELSRMTQFKDKSKKHAANINVGLFAYPTLMAADILLYQTNLVPIGTDQKQHLELARDLALRFNNIYGEVFTTPEVYHPPLGARIMSLQEPTKKMSKSDANSNAVIYILDPLDIIANKLKLAVTDSGKDICFDPVNKPGIANLLTILAVVTDKSVDQLVCEMRGQGYGKLKAAAAESLIEFLRPLQKRYKELRENHAYLNSVLKLGCQHAIKLSKPTLAKVYEVIGFVPTLV